MTRAQLLQGKRFLFPCKMQDPKLISESYEKSRKSLFVYFYSLSGDKEKAEDLVQEVFLILSKNPEKFDPEKGSLFTWGSVVGRNLFFREFKRSKIFSFQEKENMESYSSDRSDPETLFLEHSDRREKIGSLTECYRILSDPEKQIVEEKFLRNGTLENIGRKIGITKRSVSRKYAEILKKLRICLERKGVRL